MAYRSRGEGVLSFRLRRSLLRRLRRGSGRLLEDDDVLPGEEVELLLESEALRLDLAADLRERHLVLGLDGDGWVLAAEFDQDEPASGLEGFVEAFQGLLGVRAFMVDVDHQDQVD